MRREKDIDRLTDDAHDKIQRELEKKVEVEKHQINRAREVFFFIEESLEKNFSAYII